MIPEDNKTKERVIKLMTKLERLVKALEECHEVTIHRKINQFYYMQKANELKMLLHQLDEAEYRLASVSKILSAHYSEIFHHWRRDVHQLNLIKSARFHRSS